LMRCRIVDRSGRGCDLLDATQELRASRRSAWVFLAALVATASGRWSAGASSVMAPVSPFPPRPAGWITEDAREALTAEASA
jgi:hypothetical protein